MGVCPAGRPTSADGMPVGNGAHKTRVGVGVGWIAGRVGDVAAAGVAAAAARGALPAGCVGNRMIGLVGAAGATAARDAQPVAANMATSARPSTR